MLPSNSKNFQFSAGWLSGFAQSDGCFTLTLEKTKTGLRIRPRPIFNLTQDKSEEEMFKSLIKYLGAGFVNRNRSNVSLDIRSLTVLNDVLFPIFDKHQLKYGKLKAYLIFKKIVEEMLKKNHLKLEGLLRIIYLAFELNKERRTKESKDNLLKFLESVHGKLPTPEELEIEALIHSISEEAEANSRSQPLSLEFVAGLIDGDGSFNVSFQIKPYRRVKVNFTVVQESSCRDLLVELIDYFSCGKVYDLPSAASRYQVENVDLMLSNIIPVLNKTKFNTNKGVYYDIAKEVSKIIKTKGYKTDDSFKEIVELSYDSNKSGKRRHISKEEFRGRRRRS